MLSNVISYNFNSNTHTVLIFAVELFKIPIFIIMFEIIWIFFFFNLKNGLTGFHCSPQGI